jgi:hypothetical protein
MLMKLGIPIRGLAAVLLLVAVLAVFVSPAFDMPETALRAKSLAQLVVLALIAMATWLAGFVANMNVVYGCLSRDDCGSDAILPLDLKSTLRC